MVEIEAQPSPAVHNGPHHSMKGDTLRRNMDLVRAILLTIEAMDEPATLGDLVAADASELDRRTVDHLVQLMHRAGLLSGIDTADSEGPDWMDLELTWDGHDFLGSIRDPEHWREAKSAAEKVGGWTLNVFAKILEKLAMARLDRLIETGALGG